ncbi:MAG: hypothetical protein JOY64_22450 [Alphaproteobacteria bacterium]|nr:hypothetical protein [Alphaproteobacteria bacterium]MBV8410404.1 hypothetical protein [Alphaproteobacteria bacterium]
MLTKLLAAAGALMLAGGTAQAQTATSAPTLTFERAVFITCREAHAMQSEARKAIAYYLAEYSARYRGVTIPEDSRGAQIGYLVRGGCTLYPDEYLFAVIDHAIVSEMARLPKRQ